MTRKEEIQHKADEILRKGDFGLLSDYEVATHVATETAMWADKTRKEKVYKWLQEHAFKYAETYGNTKDGFKTQALLEDLKKAMEGIDIPMASPSAMGRNIYLQTYLNTSAPCSHCIFLKDLKCTFPENKKKECSRELGTTNGWNTKEYRRKSN